MKKIANSHMIRLFFLLTSNNKNKIKVMDVTLSLESADSIFKQNSLHKLGSPGQSPSPSEINLLQGYISKNIFQQHVICE